MQRNHKLGQTLINNFSPSHSSPLLLQQTDFAVMNRSLSNYDATRLYRVLNRRSDPSRCQATHAPSGNARQHLPPLCVPGTRAPLLLLSAPRSLTELAPCSSDLRSLGGSHSLGKFLAAPLSLPRQLSLSSRLSLDCRPSL